VTPNGSNHRFRVRARVLLAALSPIFPLPLARAAPGPTALSSYTTDTYD
jgi:hypothetical protein